MTHKTSIYTWMPKLLEIQSLEQPSKWWLKKVIFLKVTIVFDCIIGPNSGVSLYLCPFLYNFISCFHSDFGFSHITCFAQWDSSKFDTCRVLKKYLFSFSLLKLCQLHENNQATLKWEQEEHGEIAQLKIS